MAEENVGCARPTGSVVGVEKKPDQVSQESKKEDLNMAAVQVGQKAPDFEAPAYFKGEFKNVKLSDFIGKWVLLCFYPGDFTFV